MKGVLLYTVALIVVLFFSACQKYDNSDELKGKTFTYWNGYTGILYTKMSYTFEKDGHVTNYYNIGRVANTNKHFKYKFNGDVIMIYRDNHTYWKKEVRNTIYEIGTFHGSYIIIGGDKYVLK